MFDLFSFVVGLVLGGSVVGLCSYGIYLGLFDIADAIRGAELQPDEPKKGITRLFKVTKKAQIIKREPDLDKILEHHEN